MGGSPRARAAAFVGDDVIRILQANQIRRICRGANPGVDVVLIVRCIWQPGAWRGMASRCAKKVLFLIPQQRSDATAVLA